MAVSGAGGTGGAGGAGIQHGVTQTERPPTIINTADSGQAIFDNLPAAIIPHIFPHLSGEDAAKYSCVSKDWKESGKRERQKRINAFPTAINQDTRTVEEIMKELTPEQQKCLDALKSLPPNDTGQAIQTLRQKINKQAESAKINPILRNAASTNKIDDALLALIFGADVNEASLSGYTPLIGAAYNGHTYIVKALLGEGADVNQADSSGATPLSLAARNGYTEVVEALLAVNADVNQADNFETTPLFGATSGGHRKMVKALLEAEADVNQVSSIGTTPLFGAAFSGDPEIVEALLAAGAEVNQVNSAGDTPLSVATLNSHTEIVRMLENAASSGAASAEVQ